MAIYGVINTADGGDTRYEGFVKAAANFAILEGYQSITTVASHATTAPIWVAAGEFINYTGTATATDFPSAPQAGMHKILICAGAAVFTHAGNITVQGDATFTAEAGDWVYVHASTTTTFKLNIWKKDGRAVTGLGANTYSGVQKVPANGVQILGSNTGRTILASAIADSTDHTVTFPDKAGTVAMTTDVTAGFTIVRSARTSDTILAAADQGTLVDITGASTFTQTFTAAATLGSGWWCYYRNSGTGDVTLNPDGAETIDGLGTFVMYPGECRLIQCTGTAFFSVVLSPFYRAFITTATFTKPPGYSVFEGLLWSAGASGQKTGGATDSSGGSGGGCVDFRLKASAVGATETVTIGAGGAAQTGTAAGAVGGDSTFGSLVTVRAGATFSNGGSVIGSAATAPAGTGGVGYECGTPTGATVIACSAVWGGATASTNTFSINGGNSIYGGGGGGGVAAAGTVRTGGTSSFGGPGGDGVSAGAGGIAGTQPAGGGGATQTGTASGKGGDGECRIWGIA